MVFLENHNAILASQLSSLLIWKLFGKYVTSTIVLEKFMKWFNQKSIKKYNNQVIVISVRYILISICYNHSCIVCNSAVLVFHVIYIIGFFSLFQSKDSNLTNMCKLLGIEESQMRMWLCHRKITTVNEVLTKPLTASQVKYISKLLRCTSKSDQNTPSWWLLSLH